MSNDDVCSQQEREDPDAWLSGWVVMNYITQNLAAPERKPLDPAVLRMLEDWSGWQPQNDADLDGPEA